MEFSDILTSNDFSHRAKVKPQGVRDPCGSAQVLSAIVTSNFRVRGLWEASHSEGDAGRSPLRFRRAQRAFLGTTVYKVSRQL